MAGGYVIAEYQSIKHDFPEFERVMSNAREALLELARADWAPLTFGGMSATAGQFSESTIMPELFADRLGTRLTTWHQTYDVVNLGMTIPGHNVIMQGAQTPGYTIYEDYKIALVGFAFLDKAVRISEVKMQISDRKLPRVNLEEAMIYEKPAVVFEDFFLLDEETGFEMMAYVLSHGPQRIKLIGTQVNRVPNKMQVTNTGAALT